MGLGDDLYGILMLFSLSLWAANHPDLVFKKKGISDNKQMVCMLCNDTPEVKSDEA
jgi:hypothetical protein